MSRSDAAAYLRATATLMRDRADAAPDGRWKWIVADNPARHQLVTNDALTDIATCTENPDLPPGAAEHIAALDPEAARAIAAALELAAADADATGYPPPGYMVRIARAYTRETTP